jgi:DedD protein
MAFFKFRNFSWPRRNSAAPVENVDSLRRRALYRLIGAAVLVFVAVIGFPMVFDTQPRPLPVQAPIVIPGDNSKPASVSMPLPIPVPPPVVQQEPEPVRVVAAPAQRSFAQPAVTSSLSDGEELVSTPYTSRPMLMGQSSPPPRKAKKAVVLSSATARASSPDVSPNSAPRQQISKQVTVRDLIDRQIVSRAQQNMAARDRTDNGPPPRQRSRNQPNELTAREQAARELADMDLADREQAARQKALRQQAARDLARQPYDRDPINLDFDSRPLTAREKEEARLRTAAKRVAEKRKAEEARRQRQNAETTRARNLLEGRDPGRDPFDTSPPPERVAKTRSGGGRYIIQLGAYNTADTAQTIRRKADESGVRAYTESTSSDSGVRTRVRAGPYTSREEASRALNKLKAAGLGGSIVSP